MRKTEKILFAVILCILFISAKSYAQHDYVCIDPGHGGTDAGCIGRVYGVKEKDVNFGVGLEAWHYFGLTNWNPIMTRYEDIYVAWDQRADIANKANGGEGVDAFISIHHNATRDTVPPDTITNGTETFWCNADSTDSHWVRSDTTDTLARKAYYKLISEFHYYPRGIKHTCWDVLRLTKMGSTLSEASFLTCAEVERKFYLYFDEECAKEADALWRAGVSYLLHAGITFVKNSYSGGDVGELIVSKWDWFPDICFDTDTVTSPYTTCWLGGMFGEAYCLEAMTPQWMGGYERTFHHWAHIDHLGNPDEIHYDPLWKFEVPYFEYDYHKYVAYFSGGPYSAQVLCPDGYETWYVAEQETIKWDASVAADSTTWVYVYLDRNGGNDGYPVYVGCREAKLANYLPWTVTGPVSAHCKMKVVAEDVAGNSSWDVSDYDFNITGEGNNNPLIDGHLQCKYPQEECNECKKYGESFTLQIEAHDLDTDSIYYEWYALWGHFPNGQHTMTTAQNYVVYTAPTKAEYGGKNQFEDFLKVTVVDVRGGSNDTSGYLTLYDPETSCICGDVNDDENIDSGDLVYLINYLFAGTAPPDPIETGDVNNNCEVDAGDVTYLINYIYGGDSPPECGWICPNEKLAEFF